MASRSIVFFTNSFPVLSQTFVIDQINGLIELGHDVSIISLYPGDDSITNNVNIRRYNLLDKTRYLLARKSKSQATVSALLSILSKQVKLLFTKPNRAVLIWFSILLVVKKDLNLAKEVLSIGLITPVIPERDIIIAHFGHMGVIANYLRKAKIISGKLLTVFHGYEISEYKQIKRWKRLYKWLSETSERLLPISELWAKRLKDFGVPIEKIQVHHMGIDTSKFAFQDKPLSSPLNILTVARATEKKGLTYALEAIEMSDIQLQYHVIGGGELLDELKAQVAAYNRKDDIIFHGPQPPEVVQKALQKADIFLLPSVTDKQGDMEGIPVSLMEAMASGVVVISTLHSGIPELIEDGVSGYLVEEKCATSIARSIKRIVSEKDLSSLRSNAKSKVVNDFNSHNLNQSLSDKISTL